MTESQTRAAYLIACSAASGETYSDEYSDELRDALAAECEDDSEPGSGETRYDSWGTDSSGREWRVELV